MDAAPCQQLNPRRRETAGKPRIAVIVPAYGVAHLVPEALRSLLEQSFTQWECVVIDDGAPDDVAGAVEPFLADSRIRFLATPNHGVSAARNTAIAATSAPLIALLDGDDRLLPDYLDRMVAAMEADRDIRIATCNARIFGAVLREKQAVERWQGTGDGIHGSLSDILAREFNVYIGSVFRRDDFDAIGGFDEAMAYSEDFDLWVRLMQRGGRAFYVDAMLGEYRVRANSASSSAEKMLLGNIRVYEKAAATLEGRPESELARQLADVNRQELAFEHAIERIIDGDTQGGLENLKTLRAGSRSAIWKLSLVLWRVLPGFARPMLRMRRRANERGNTRSFFAYLPAGFSPSARECA